MAKSKYNCTQQQLYTLSRAAWQNCSDRLTVFAALKAKYTAAFVTGKLTEINTAEALPDDEQRKATAALLREQLSVKAVSCRDHWQRLKLYIEDAYPENEEEVHLSAAGATHYNDAVLEIHDTTSEELFQITYEEAMKAIKGLRDKFGGSALFGNEKDESFQSSLGAIYT